MNVPELYPFGATNFSISGTPIEEAYNISVHKRNSAAWMASFDLPINAPVLENITEGAVVRVDGQLYVVDVITDGISDGVPYARVSGIHVFWVRCNRVHIPRTMWIGLPADRILSYAFSDIFYGVHRIRQLTAQELAGIGLEPVTIPTDIYRDRVTPLEVAARVRKHVGGEFYVDNFNFALVKRIGVDTGDIYTLNIQTSGIERIVDDSRNITRLFPYGRNGVEITSVAGVNFIDSPHIGDNPEFVNGRQDQMDFADFDDTRVPQLLAAAQWQFSPDNYWRIDRPRVSYSMSAVDLWKIAPEEHTRLNMGDSVTMSDPGLNIRENVRVVAMEVYPYEPRSTVYTLGDPPRLKNEILAAADENNQINNQFIFNLDALIEEILEKIDLGQVEGFLPLWRRFPTVNDTTPAPPAPPEENNTASGISPMSGASPSENGDDNGDGPEPPAPPPLPPGVYSITHVPHVDLHHDEQWQELVQSGAIVPDVLYAGAYEGEFEDAVTEAVQKVLAALPTVGG